MTKLTYESDNGLKLDILVDESVIKECSTLGIAAWQEILEVVRKEIEAEKSMGDQ